MPLDTKVRIEALKRGWPLLLLKLTEAVRHFTTCTAAAFQVFLLLKISKPNAEITKVTIFFFF